MNKKEFSQQLLEWFDEHGRKDLPWQKPRSAYNVWVSEIMLQQTQVQTVIGYFDRFMQRFPDLSALAAAEEDEVLSLWSGLGYYSRARNLHKTAKMIVTDYQANFPSQLEELIKLPGIGASTAAAIATQAFNLPAAILDGNVKRVLSRYFEVEGWPQQSKVHKKLQELAEECLPKERFADYTQAIMDLGALCCTPKNPACERCPVQQHCQAYNNNTTAQYPAKKPKKKLPTQHWQFLLVHNAHGQIYLEKRPGLGLWGGLWCLPQLEQEQCALTYLKQEMALEALEMKPFMQFKHSFSHFHLNIQANSLQALPDPCQIKENSGDWFHPEQLDGLGLARPVSLILQEWFSKRTSKTVDNT